MPVKWNSETDQVLLLKILETSDVSPKCVEISEKWPANLDRPTPRAISERIVKIRQLAKASGTSSHFSISNAKSQPSTPRKNAANGSIKKATPKKTNGSKAKAGKRKRSSMLTDNETDDDTDFDGFKTDNNASDASDEDETPRKRSKANTVATSNRKDKDLIKVKSEEAENGAFDDSSSYKNPSVEDDPMGMVDYA